MGFFQVKCREDVKEAFEGMRRRTGGVPQSNFVSALLIGWDMLDLKQRQQALEGAATRQQSVALNPTPSMTKSKSASQTA